MSVFMLASMAAFSQATVTTLTDANHGKPGYKNGNTFSAAQFRVPSGIALDPSGTALFMADSSNNAVRMVNYLGDKANSYTYSAFTNKDGISQPVDVAIDANTNIYVLNRGTGKDGTILKFNGLYYLNYGIKQLLATNATKLTNATALALDGAANLYATIQSNTVIRIIGGSNQIVGIVTNKGTSLRGIVVLSSGNLVLTDAGNNGIWVMNPANTNLVGNTVKLTGFNGAADVLGPPAYAAFNRPEKIAKAGNGYLVVADYNNNKVKIIDAGGYVTRLYGVSSTYWGNSYPGWHDGTVNPNESIDPVEARQPCAVVVANDGTVYATEIYYSLLRVTTGTGLTGPPPPPPTAPSFISVITNFGQVTLTWSAVNSATNYYLKRSTNSGGIYSTIFSGSSTNYNDTNVVNGTTYYYVVSAINSSGEGPNSAEVSATPLPPPAPTFVTVIANYGVVSLTWSTVPGANSYNLRRSPSTNGPFTLITSTSSTSYNDTTVINGSTYYYIVSAVNPGGEGSNSAYIIAQPPFPPVPDPQIGYVDFPSTATPEYTSVFHPVSTYQFYNDANIVIKGTDGSGTYYTYDGTIPTTNSSSVLSDYHDGITSKGGLSPYLVNHVEPNFTIEAFGAWTNHPNSAVVQATFQFITGNPNIIGNNAAQFYISDITAGCDLYYTIDGSEPTATSPTAVHLNPVATPTNLWTVGFPVISNTTFKVRAFRANYQPSAIVTTTFSASNFVANVISFGFGNGEASSDFVASPGQYFYAPVTLSPLSDTKIYSLQFNLTVTNLGATPVEPGLYDFESMLTKPTPKDPTIYEAILPAMFVSTNAPIKPNWVKVDGSTNFASLIFYNTNNNLLGVGWLERAGKTNLYDTTAQDLILTSQAHDTVFKQSGGKVIVGGYAFRIPPTANSNDTYQIQIGRPSATSDGIGAAGSDVFIAAPTNGSTAGGAPLNALKIVKVGQRKYLAGSAYPFRWFNAGDFGSTNLVSADVMQVFQSAVYSWNYPPFNPDSWNGTGFTNVSDFFDTMDSCGNIGINDGTGIYTNAGDYTVTYPTTVAYSTTNYTYIYDTNNVPTNNPVISSTTNGIVTIYANINAFTVISFNTNIYPYNTNFNNVASVTNTISFVNQLSNLFDGNDTTINQIAFGDGYLDVCDVYVTFRRALDPSLTWYRRFWNNGQRVADTGLPNAASHLVAKPVTAASSVIKPKVGATGSKVSPQVNFTAGDIQGSAGQVVSVPISATILGSYPLRVLMLNLTVDPLDGSPAITAPVQFNQTAPLGAPYTTDAQGNGNFSAVWLNSTNAGLTGTVTLGNLLITIPASASSNAAYAVHFDHASASPNGLASFPRQTLTGLITLSARTNSSFGDGIPDSWRLRWFGSVNNYLSLSNACPSGDGISNFKKYVAGIDPNVANNFPSVNAITPAPVGYSAIHWPTVLGKQYVIERTSSFFAGPWTAIGTNTGTGGDMEFDDAAGGTVKFYRVRILP